MFPHTADQAFRRYQRSGDPRALARVFDKTAGELLGLARHLGSGEAAAEDLVQATFVTVIESAPSFDAERAVLPWLVGILANHARAARRKSRRVLDPSRLPVEAGLDPVDAAAGGELRAQVATAIEGLPEAQRPVLRLLLEHGLTPTEIARTLERPAATVRVQIHRGLALLRAALPAAVGGRVVLAGAVDAGPPARGLDAVRAAVLVRCGEQVGGTVAAGAFSLGVLTAMNLKLISAVVLAAVLAVFAYQGFGEASVAQEPIEASSVTVATEPTATPRVADAPAEAVVQRDAVPAPVEAEPVREGEPAVRVTVRWADDRSPAVGVGVWLVESARMQDPRAALGPRKTDDAGSVAFARIEPSSYMIFVDRVGPVNAFVHGGTPAQTREVLVPRGLTIEGVVRDARGAVVADARVVGHSSVLPPSELARTDAQGRYSIRDAGANIEIQAWARGRAPSLAHLVAGAPGTRVTLDLALLGAGRRVAGRVLDADGQPAPHANVAALRAAAPTPPPGAMPKEPSERAVFTRADAEGRFTFEGVSTDASIFVAQPMDPGAALGRALLAAGDADGFVDVRLRRAATLRGTIKDRGRPLRGGSVYAWPERPVDDIGYLLNTMGLGLAQTDKDGNYLITGLVPGDYQVTVTRESKLKEARLTLAEGQDATLDLRCGEGLALRVEVTPPRPPAEVGVPVWMVNVSRVHADGNLEFVNIMPTTTSRLRFTDLDAGTYAVQVGCQLVVGSQSFVYVTRRDVVVPQTGPLILAIDAAEMPRAYVDGRLIDEQGQPIANVAVVLTGRHATLTGRVEVRSGDDGRFRAGPLPVGDYAATVARRTPHPLGDLHVEAAGRDLGDVTLPQAR